MFYIVSACLLNYHSINFTRGIVRVRTCLSRWNSAPAASRSMSNGTNTSRRWPHFLASTTILSSPTSTSSSLGGDSIGTVLAKKNPLIFGLRFPTKGRCSKIGSLHVRTEKIEFQASQKFELIFSTELDPWPIALPAAPPPPRESRDRRTPSVPWSA